MTSASDIETLLARVSIGDRKAFSELYDATNGKLFGVALRVLNDRASAEDVLQEAYMKVWRYADRYTNNGMSPMTWMITIARNTAIDRIRRSKQTETLDGVADYLVAPGPTPEQSVEAAGEAGRIAACIGQLEPDKGRAVRGAYLEGLIYADLAEKFNVPLNTMRTWLHRSLQSLRECMDQ